MPVSLERVQRTRAQLPSLQDRRKVRVESISFLILIRASRTIGPHLEGSSTPFISTDEDFVTGKSTGFSLDGPSEHHSGVKPATFNASFVILLINITERCWVRNGKSSLNVSCLKAFLVPSEFKEDFSKKKACLEWALKLNNQIQITSRGLVGTKYCALFSKRKGTCRVIFFRSPLLFL